MASGITLIFVILITTVMISEASFGGSHEHVHIRVHIPHIINEVHHQKKIIHHEIEPDHHYEDHGHHDHHGFDDFGGGDFGGYEHHGYP
ncbi:histidine-rich glycoprotein-like [Zootermopsis nevadensis]|nr:histidine-rich glycoprotein-like [Zootermopsis nevadensis]